MHNNEEQFDDDDDLGGMYDNGHWEWDEKSEGLKFITHPKQLEEISWLSPPPATIIGTMEFKDDIDVIEQQRFKKRFQRKTFDGDVICLQDIKDVVLYTAPPSVLNIQVVYMLHMPVTERFLRALIFYIQYYLQVSDEMSRRVLELESKIRTETGDEIERRYKENLEDLRLLIAKEYSNVLTGSGEFKKFHHMGPTKKMPSLTKKSNLVFESLLRIAIQIVWLALGRKFFNQIEIEMHRLFKTSKFNMMEHQLKTNYMANLSAQERNVLFGECMPNEKMLKIHSPLLNVIKCDRSLDCRLLGLGVVKYPHLSPRLQYMQDALIAPESQLSKKHVSLGILGLRRSRFDIMLKEIIHTAASFSSIGLKMSFASLRRSMTVKTSPRSSGGSLDSQRKQASASSFIKKFPDKLIPDIELPWRDSDHEELPPDFPKKMLPQNPCDQLQKRKWLARVARLHALRVKRERFKNKIFKYYNFFILTAVSIPTKPL